MCQGNVTRGHTIPPRSHRNVPVCFSHPQAALQTNEYRGSLWTCGSFQTVQFTYHELLLCPAHRRAALRVLMRAHQQLHEPWNGALFTQRRVIGWTKGKIPNQPNSSLQVRRENEEVAHNSPKSRPWPPSPTTLNYQCPTRSTSDGTPPHLPCTKEYDFHLLSPLPVTLHFDNLPLSGASGMAGAGV